MADHRVVSHEQWVEERKALLAREKELTRLRDELSRARRELSWQRVAKSYKLDTEKGRRTLAELFEGRRQLVVFHFMFGPDWEAGCPSCSFWADNFERNVVHLSHRDITMIAVSRAPLEKLLVYRDRMGWTFPWASSFGSDFNRDYDVSFDADELEMGDVCYNYQRARLPSEEAPGISVFYRDGDGSVYHTYSSYSRGLDMLNAGYHIMDLTPKGRDEDGLDYPMAWLRRRDEY